MRAVRAMLAAVVGSLLVALLGALAGGLVAVGFTLWLVPEDPFAIVVFGLALLLLWEPLGAIFAVWLLSLLADEDSAESF